MKTVKFKSYLAGVKYCSFTFKLEERLVNVMSEGRESRTENLILDRLKAPFGSKDVPKFLGYASVFGPGLVWAGLSQGSGELIWWPYMVTKYGLFFVGWLIVWAFLQYWYNQEIGRYTVATGESIFEGWHRVHHILGWFMLIMAVVFYSWVGGYLGGAASALATITGFPGGWSFAAQGQFWSTVLIIILYIIMLLGPVAYRVVEVIESIAALASFFGMLLAIIAVPAASGVAGEYLAALFQPKLGLPSGWDPADVGILITMIAYTGAGGFWNMAYSYWIRDKNWGQSTHIGRVTSPITGKPEAIPSIGFGFEATDENVKEYSKWTNTLWVDNAFGVILNMATIFLTSILSYGILRPMYLAGKIEVPKGWKLIVVQGEWLGAAWGVIGRDIMLLLGFFFLFDTFVTAGDFYSRIVTSNSYTNLEGKVKNTGLTWLGLFIPMAVFMLPFSYDPKLIAKNPALGWAGIIIAMVYTVIIAALMTYSSVHNWEYRKTYYGILTVFYGMGLAQLFLKKPGPLILLTGVTSMGIMVLACWVLLYLNWFLLPKIHPAGKHVRPKWFNFLILLGISIVFTYTFAWYLSLQFG